MNTRVGQRCWVRDCRNSERKTIARTRTQLFKFPRDVKRCRDWLRAIGDPHLAKWPWEKLTKHRYVCRDHFWDHNITATQRVAANAIPCLFPEPRTPLSEADLVYFDQSVPVERRRSTHDYTSYGGINPHVQEPPIMDNIYVEAESIIKLEEVKEELNDNVDESPWNLLELGDSNTFQFSVKEEYNAEEAEEQPPLSLPLLQPKEEIVEVEDEAEMQPPQQLPLLVPKEEFAEIREEEEMQTEMQPLLPLQLLEPKEEVAEIKEEEEVELQPPQSLPLLEPKKEATDKEEEKMEDLELPTVAFIKSSLTNEAEAECKIRLLTSVV